MTSSPPPATGDVSPLVERLFRTEYGRMVAILTRTLGPGQVALAEDVAQEALMAALRHWPLEGVPREPRAWLLQVARRKALDAIRRERFPAARAAALQAEFEGEGPAGGEAAIPDAVIADAELRLIFLCCHPALPGDSRVALTLKLAGGFGVEEIARAFLAEPAAIAQRLVRAKRLFREVGADFELPPPAELAPRLDSVLEVLYLLFNEGHAGHRGEALLRRELAFEAIRLAELLLARAETAGPRVDALLALFLFQAARFPARTDAAGGLVRLADQDRGRWDRAMIARGFHHLDRSARGREESAWHLEAAIAACHAAAPSWSDTDWGAIVAGYDRLLAVRPNPVASLNRAVAIAERDGPGAALAAVEAVAAVPAMARYHLFHGVRGDLLERLGRQAEAREAFRTARALVEGEVVGRYLEGRLARLGGG